ncbi:magnesium transporter NIPA-domain-containing protein [Diplogelasinospora grovesii]|uniref:Magnesium transporter NIPA-domain-containing protein n=1 Tax=Diplogelasinospora grovesii TaxID=303347 RepID=A0AAN6N3C7_9PEZI|nr:magnesium transporter NIPA-domain-containing protein [Diplogelasinospora grovesii]
MGPIGGISNGGTIALGIVVGLMSTSIQSLGLTLQRKSHILEDEKGPYDVRRPPYRRRRWQLGMAMFIISNVLGSSIQISVLPLPVLSTLQASGLVFNSICATLILGEPFTRWSLWGTLLVCAGAVLIAIFGAIATPAHSLKELLELLGRRPFVLWMSFQAVLVVGVAVATELISHLGTLMQDVRFRLARGFAYGCISGILSAHSLLVAKSAVELILRTIVGGENQFNHWQAWMLVLGLLTLALSQLYYLHRGLKLVSTSVLYPLIFCVYNIVAILDGLIYFDQTDLISPLHACLIALGTVILLSGVLALSWRLSDEQHTPGVGQSSLAPGLGLVEDTDGEEEEEELLLSSDIGDAEDDGKTPDTQPYSYQTFGSAGEPAAAAAAAAAVSLATPKPKPPRRQISMAQPTRTSSSRWAERAEIWGELEDRDTPDTPSPAINRRRSTTLPIRSESTPLLFSRRVVGGASDVLGLAAARGDASATTDQLPPSSSSPRRALRRRRKSTGFPGFTARKTFSGRKTWGGGLQDAVGSIWTRWRWWSNNRKGKGPQTPRPVSWAATSAYTDRDSGDADETSGGGGDSTRHRDAQQARSGSTSRGGPAFLPGTGGSSRSLGGSSSTRPNDSPV